MKTLFLSSIALVVPIFAGELTLEEAEGKLTLKNGAQDILVYHMAELPPPEGVAKDYRRSGFIHPLKTPKGGVLTGIHPSDHYHHMGLWHAWVKTKHGASEPDFWNIGKGKARVRFQKLLSKTEKQDQVGFVALQEQLSYLGEQKKETIVLREEFTVTASRSGDLNIIDYQVTQTNVSGVALELPAYRYGGPLAYRGPESWNMENSEYLTSEGKTRVNSHTTRANWCAVFGPTETGPSSLVFLCHPENHDAPQRLRTWPSGQMFLNWVPAQETGFTINAGDTADWSYRLLASDKTLSAEEIQAEWDRWTQQK